ncbi:ABC transporter permease [Spirosoma sp. KUDC1026]|uniref:ABC transporter permease n=1 Tax=Spirosoma sp. KUDC1026 TaxID=2745947 RepID=UPI00159B96E6|nr:ABC transporter permease [Spirosoma sp. KUDC1026]QKZ12835.1 ABC transporter permease [Spirosoma sp. KUDC1026]
MLSNYLKIAWRNLWRNKVFSAINILGLSAGIASCLLLFMYITHELSYDDFHQKADRLMRVTMEYSMDGQVSNVAVTGTKVAPEFGRQFPEVEAAVRLINYRALVHRNGRHVREKRFLFADSAFFSLFSFPLLKGDPQTALSGPNKVVLSKNTAQKYFGHANPLGKTMRISAGGEDHDYLVTGVVADSPQNSQLKYDMLASFTTLPEAGKEEWWSANYATYLLLRSPDALPSLQAKIPGFMKTQFGPDEMKGGNYLTYHLEPIRRVHLHSDVEGNFEPNGDLLYIVVFSSIALLILLIACVNYVNLATARAVERAQEVGVRKVMGALRRQLFGQFMGELILVTFMAMTLGLLLAYFMLPLFNELADRSFSFSVWLHPTYLLLLLGTGLAVSLIAGGYPALVIARFQPIRALSGHLQTTRAGRFRRTLVVIQFSITAFLISSTLLIRSQLTFIQNKKLGYTKEQVLVLPANQQVNNKIDALKSEFRRSAGVASVSRAYESPVFIQGGYSMHRQGTPDDKTKPVTALPADEDFIQTMGVRILAGRNLTTADMERVVQKPGNTAYYHFILNESAAKELGWKPAQAIGQKMDMGGNRVGEVGAVVEDFHFASLKRAIGPLIIFPDTWGNVVLVKLTGTNVPATLQFLENRWHTLIPDRPFEYSFLNDDFNKLYSTETRTGQVFSVFAFLSIFLACLGLFGLSAYTVAQRTKEIGVRKVLGASIPSIVTLLSRDFLTLVALATVIALPLVWYAMTTWLQGFAYHVGISWWTIALAGLLELGIALLIVSFQSIRAALVNPVKSLRSE